MLPIPRKESLALRISDNVPHFCILGLCVRTRRDFSNQRPEDTIEVGNTGARHEGMRADVIPQALGHVT